MTRKVLLMVGFITTLIWFQNCGGPSSSSPKNSDENVGGTSPGRTLASTSSYIKYNGDKIAQVLSVSTDMQTSFRTLDLAIQFYKTTEDLKLTGNLKDQLTRASSSIALNLSEGNAKPSAKEKKRYYQTAYASLKECETIFKLANVQSETVIKSADHLGACLYKLTKADLKTDSFRS